MSSFLTGRTSLTTVNSGDIADDAVTLAKMAAGTANYNILYDGSGNPAEIASISVAQGGTGAATHTANNVLVGAGTSAIASVAPSTSGNVLTSNGSAWTSAAAGGGGAWTLIGTQVASNSADLTQTGFDSTYDTYAIAISDFIVASSSTTYLQVGDSGGIDSGGGDYSYTLHRRDEGGSHSLTQSAGASQIQISSGSIGTGTGEGYGCIFYLHRPGDGTMQPMFTGHSIKVSGGEMYSATWEARREAVITLTQIKVYQSDGNITSGRMTVWGIAHA
jgi:hypothetical protein